MIGHILLGSKLHRHHALGKKVDKPVSKVLKKVAPVAKTVGKGVAIAGGVMGLAAAATGGDSDVKMVPSHSATYRTLRGR